MQKVIIDIPNLSNLQNVVNGSLASALIIKAYKNGIFIHKNATNGEVIQALFPNIDKGFSNVIDLNLWWNANYKAESEDKGMTDEQTNDEQFVQALGNAIYQTFKLREDGETE